ncbi:MAG: hypothetical protein WCW35_01955 [Bacteroidota bacterium]
MTKYQRLLLVLSIFIAIQCSQGQSRNFGIGLIIGEPTGISAKLWTTSENAFDFGFGWSMDGNGMGRYDDRYYYNDRSRVHFHMDYLWHAFSAIHSGQQFPLYYGIGGSVNSGSGYASTVAVRGVFGISWLPRDTPVDVFLELVPTLRLTNTSGLYIGAGFGARYYL